MGLNDSAPTRRTFLSVSAAATAAAAVLPAAAASAGPAGIELAGEPADLGGPGRPITPQRPDAQLRSLLRDIDPARVEATVRRLAAFGTRHTLSTQDDPVRGIGAARDWIFAQLSAYAAESGGRMTVEVQSYLQPVASRIPVPTVISNIVATVHGQISPDRVYVITGHYDSRVTDVMNATGDAPGADDDASGVAVVLELARVMATRPSAATIVLAAVAGEEQGLYGSAYLAQQLKANGADVQGMVSNDIVGSPVGDDGVRHDRLVRMFAEGVPTAETAAEAATRRSIGGENDSVSRQLARYALATAQNEHTGMNIRLVYRRDRYLRGSDHISFLNLGYPGCRFSEPREDFAHQHQDVRVENGVQYGDLPEFCDFRYIARVAKVNAALFWSLAQAPGTPKAVKIDTSALTNKSTLRWTRGSEPDLAGYEIVWRESSAPDWTHVVEVGDVTTATIDLSKDNVQFGVRAVDQAGHRSPAAAPTPG
ncbi:hypothetical protein HDA40_002255 [Hamadaea flava]|uniref:M28 family metallopeptidase n=1 Tax=Hamadaea flava TaxID=1742688 RepID=A0ABV8LNE3_9ACTN|nr:M28 family metallopeptidase [Hamadaea flava]MCP2323748.1 hypothetical protein [Hamadaea flava]